MDFGKMFVQLSMEAGTRRNHPNQLISNVLQILRIICANRFFGVHFK